MYEIKTKGMHCGSCADSIALALRAIDPGLELTADIASQIISIKSGKSASELTPYIEAAGYPVLEIKKNRP